MINEEIIYRISQAFPFEPTGEQRQAIHTFCDFLTDRHDQVAMILRGSAGTGKTTLAGAIVKALLQLHHKMMLMAPTGRAAKVFSLYSGCPAYTIHRRIYRQKSIDAGIGGFTLNDNLYRDTLFIIDEASMVSNQRMSADSFGSGCLLDDLIDYVYGLSVNSPTPTRPANRLMLIGDKAQLPPVGEAESPALQASVLEGYGLKVYEADLNEVLRQSYGSGILYNATVIRSMITHDELTQLPLIRFQGFADIKMVPGDELIEQLASSYSEVGLDETMVVTRSNKRANIYNQGIRNMVLGREEELTSGDMLMIVRNNYHWIKPQPPVAADRQHPPVRGTDRPATTAHLQSATTGKEAESAPLTFIANGDRAKVWRVRNVHELYGFRFAELTIQFPDYDDYELTATAVLDSLTTEATALTPEQNDKLFEAVMADYADIPLKADRLKALKEDKYYNALQVKFAYAVTCHKAQGGQWAHVYVDQGYMTDDMLTTDYIHWLYTAFTRATEKLYLVNWPKTQTRQS